jgi:hypothetical protein
MTSQPQGRGLKGLWFYEVGDGGFVKNCVTSFMNDLLQKNFNNKADSFT